MVELGGIDSMYRVLYKISGTGKVLEWWINVDPIADGFEISIRHGQKDGKKDTSREIISAGKNIGKANETTPYAQAHAQAKARWVKQIDKGYRETIEEAQKAAKSAHKPMLAHKWDDKRHTIKIGDRVAVQAKLDGMRCLATKDGEEVTLKSRGGKPIESVPHIVEGLKLVMEDGETWDGELYVHGMEFETIMSICKRKSKNLHPLHEVMEYHVFDVVGTDMYLGRTLCLSTVESSLGYRGVVRYVKCVVMEVDDEFDEKVEEHLRAYEEQGYEGIIIRRLGTPYEHKRSKQLIKLKTFKDEEFIIVGSGTGTSGTDKDGLLVNFYCAATGQLDQVPENFDAIPKEEKKRLLDEKKVFKAPLCGSEQKLREMWEYRSDYPGELATCKFQEKTKYGIPRFPKVKGVRGLEDLS